MLKRVIDIFIVIVALSFMVFVSFEAYSFNNRLSRMEQQIEWMDEAFQVTVPEFYADENGHVGTTEVYIDMQEMLHRLDAAMAELTENLNKLYK